MNNLNSILIEGNLVRDPVYRETKGKPVCTFTIESNRYKKVDNGFENEVSFFDIETWGKLAESCYNLGHKGRDVRVVGRIQQLRWEGSDGKPHSRIVIVGEHCEFRPMKQYNEQCELAIEDPVPDEEIYEPVEMEPVAV